MKSKMERTELLTEDQGTELYSKKKKKPQRASKAIKQWLTAPCATMFPMPQRALTYAFFSWIQILTCW